LGSGKQAAVQKNQSVSADWFFWLLALYWTKITRRLGCNPRLVRGIHTEPNNVGTFCRNRTQIEERVKQAAELALQCERYVSALDVLIGIAWVQPAHVDQWRKGRTRSLERVIQVNLNKISYAMKSFRDWATQKGLQASETPYLARTVGPKRELQFRKSGDKNTAPNLPL